MENAGVVTDTFFNGGLRVNQYDDGYRFSIDAVLLAYFTRPRPEDRIVDLGTGCGIIPLILSRRRPQASIVGIELQPRLARLAQQNVSENLRDDRIRVLCADMVTLRPADTGGMADLVVSNPPYRKADSGRINPAREKAVARHEVRVTLGQLLATAAAFLDPGGRFAAIYPAERLVDLTNGLRTNNIEPKRIRMVHSNRESPAKRVLVEGMRGGRPAVIIEKPLMIYTTDGAYTEEVAAMFEGK